ncbi:MAG: response regulator [Spirochaetia bacterium]
MRKVHRIFVVDDHAVMRDGIKQILEQEEDLKVSGEAEDAPEARDAILEDLPDVVIVDISLAGSSGLDLIQDLRIQVPAIKILVMSMHEEMVFAERVLRAGARGYIMKQASGTELIRAIRSVLEGRIYLSDQTKDRILERLHSGPQIKRVDPFDELSTREIEVFQLIGRGYKTKEIAEQLKISGKTVDTYRERLKVKLGLSSSSELVREAIEWVHHG